MAYIPSIQRTLGDTDMLHRHTTEPVFKHFIQDRTSSFDRETGSTKKQTTEADPDNSVKLSL